MLLASPHRYNLVALTRDSFLGSGGEPTEVKRREGKKSEKMESGGEETRVWIQNEIPAGLTERFDTSRPEPAEADLDTAETGLELTTP